MLDTPTGQIFGSAVIPAAKVKMPVALIIAGSGPTDRNGNSRGLPGANNSLMLLAQALGEAGSAWGRYYQTDPVVCAGDIDACRTLLDRSARA